MGRAAATAVEEQATSIKDAGHAAATSSAEAVGGTTTAAPSPASTPEEVNTPESREVGVHAGPEEIERTSAPDSRGGWTRAHWRGEEAEFKAKATGWKASADEAASCSRGAI